ncbi:MAG: hemolysin family protein [Mobilitalea sp.]
MEDGNPIAGMIVILLLILLNAFVSSMKAALIHINNNSVKKRADSGEKSAQKLIKVIVKPNKYLMVLDFLRYFIIMCIGMSFFSLFLPGIESIIEKSGINLEISIVKPICYILLSIILCFITVLFGSTLPRKLAIGRGGMIAYKLVDILRFLSFIFRPLSWISEKVLNLILLTLGINPSELSENVTEEEIISMMNEGHEQGVFDAGELEMMSNIIELDEKEAQDIMTPKKKIVALSTEMTIEEALHFMLLEKYSRYPLYEDNRDNIVGILYLKDVTIAYLSEELKNKSLKEIAREAYFVPDTQNINILFHDMQEKNIHLAIAIDEYGQTAGLVALEDFLEEIVGNIQDEYDVEEDMVISKDADSVTVKGAFNLEEMNDLLDISLENDDFDTLNGLLISLLDRIPGDGEKATLRYAGYQFDILETKDKMIQQVRISKISETTEENKDDMEVNDDSW